MALTLAGCYTADEVRTQPVLFERTVALPTETLISCLSGKLSDAFRMTPQPYPARRMAYLTMSRGEGTAADFELHSQDDGMTRVLFRPVPLARSIGDVVPRARGALDECAARGV